MRVGLVYSDDFLLHEAPEGHPENPGRLRAIMDHLRATGLSQRLHLLSFGAASAEHVALVHDPSYIEWVRSRSDAGGGILDAGDTCANAHSFRVALLAAGGVIAAVEAVANDRVDQVLCLVRPPGHHAERDRAMGFCIFNNVAIGARYALDHLGIERVLIVDFDVHHGNGTQNAFWSDPRVFYVSLHQFPHYPGTGRSDEVGDGPGRGFTRNFPMPPGAPEEAWLRVFQRDLPAIADDFRPQILMLSAGFDAHRRDPLAHQSLTTSGYRTIARALLDLASRHCGARIVLVLEGGYDRSALSEGIEAFARVFLESDRGDGYPDGGAAPPPATDERPTRPDAGRRIPER